MMNTFMKIFRKMAWLVVVLQLAIIIYVIISFNVDDMTLVKGDVYSFDTGWTLYAQDGTAKDITLPYAGKSEPYETVVLENTVPQEFAGLTMKFLSADKQVRVLVDGVEIYQFGTHDERAFGNTPGSVMNFVDLPNDLGEGKIQIEMMSPYADYAVNIDSIEVGKRDIVILRHIAGKLPAMVCNIVILFAAIILGAVALIELAAKGTTGGLEFLCPFCLVSFVYFSIETKALNIIYGNQTLYSILVFFCLMMMPILLQLYFEKTSQGIYRKISSAMLVVSICNALVQIVLQVTGTLDLMNMVVFSHLLIFTTIIFAAVMYINEFKKDNLQNREFIFMIAAISCMGAGAIIDLLRQYTVRVGDFGKYSRIGFTAFGVLMVYIYVMRMSRLFAENAEKEAHAMQREKERIEEQNRVLTLAREEAEAARQEAQDANRAKSSFLANISHEIRTPINAVLGMDTMILRESHETNIREYARDINSAGKNLLSLINDVLDFSKIESGKMEITPTEYELTSLLGDCYNLIQIRAKDKGLFFRMENSQSIPHLLYGDEVRIRQIIINLLTNAVKYTEKGDVVLSADWERISVEEILLIIGVKDTGMGIRYEDQQHLFDSFSRFDMKRNRKIEGTGLGLSITKQLVEMMNGKISVESSYGRGSTFTVEIPQLVKDSAPIGDFQLQLEERLDSNEEYQGNFRAPNARILVVDDVPMNLKVICELLKGTQIQIDAVESGKECLRNITLKKYNIIFLDHMMPEMDGIETLRNMQWVTDNKNTDTPVVMLTANAIIGAKDEYLSMGFNDYLSKPVKESELEMMIRKYLPSELVVEYGEGADVQEVQETENTEEKQETPLPPNIMLRLDFLDTRAGVRYCAGSEAIYCEAIRAYMAGKLRDEIVDYYEKEDWKNYCVKVHALKSTSLNIGAVELSELAKALESASRTGDIAFTKAQHENMIKEYDELLGRLREVVGEIS